MKRFFLLLIVFISLTWASSALAITDGGRNLPVCLQIGCNMAVSGGNTRSLDSFDDSVKAELIQKTAYLPSRAVARLLAVDLKWDENSSTVVLKKNGRTLECSSATGQMRLDGVLQQNRTITINGRMYLPVRFFCEKVLGYQVVYKNGYILITEEVVSDIDSFLNELVPKLKLPPSADSFYAFKQEVKMGVCKSERGGCD